MLKIHLATPDRLEVLCLGAHCDDIEIGCGGTMLRLAQEHKHMVVHWIVFAATPQREAEARASAAAFLEGVAERQVVIKRWRDGFFPYAGAEIKEYFEELKVSCNPDVVFTHYRDDRHQDHRVISDLAWNTFRNHLILEYEIPKYDGDLGAPNLFVQLDEATCRQKTAILLRDFVSQTSKPWFTEDTFMSLMRLRGVESYARYAEAFYSRKLSL